MDHLQLLKNADGNERFLVAEVLAVNFVQYAFPELWKRARNSVEEKEKEDIAKEMFYAGASQMLLRFLESISEEDSKEMIKGNMPDLSTHAHLN